MWIFENNLSNTLMRIEFPALNKLYNCNIVNYLSYCKLLKKQNEKNKIV